MNPGIHLSMKVAVKISGQGFIPQNLLDRRGRGPVANKQAGEQSPRGHLLPSWTLSSTHKIMPCYSHKDRPGMLHFLCQPVGTIMPRISYHTWLSLLSQG